jgi:hypothetical protein
MVVHLLNGIVAEKRRKYKVAGALPLAESSG